MDVRQVVAGTRPLSALFPAKQRAFLSQHAPVGLAFDKLSMLGPILVLKLRFDPDEYQRRLVAELWMYPDNSRALELSTKCDPQEAFLVAAETRAFPSRRGVDLSGKQETNAAGARVLCGAARWPDREERCGGHPRAMTRAGRSSSSHKI
jgi:hypothetical protein